VMHGHDRLKVMQGLMQDARAEDERKRVFRLPSVGHAASCATNSSRCSCTTSGHLAIEVNGPEPTSPFHRTENSEALLTCSASV
jgi:hypothetical protein